MLFRSRFDLATVIRGVKGYSDLVITPVITTIYSPRNVSLIKEIPASLSTIRLIDTASSPIEIANRQ